jgi:hypothetical protein
VSARNSTKQTRASHDSESRALPISIDALELLDPKSSDSRRSEVRLQSLEEPQVHLPPYTAQRNCVSDDTSLKEKHIHTWNQSYSIRLQETLNQVVYCEIHWRTIVKPGRNSSGNAVGLTRSESQTTWHECHRLDYGENSEIVLLHPG